MMNLATTRSFPPFYVGKGGKKKPIPTPVGLNHCQWVRCSQRQWIKKGSVVVELLFPCACLTLQEAEANGQDYDRLKLLEVSAEEADRLEKKKKKKNPDQGFAGIQTPDPKSHSKTRLWKLCRHKFITGGMTLTLIIIVQMMCPLMSCVHIRIEKCPAVRALFG